MSGVNKAILIGRLGADPEVRFSGSGTAIANVNIATSERFTDRQGEKQERTEWHRVVMFGRLAEIAQQYLKKGRQVYIEGRLQTRQWEDKEGQKRYTTEIVANVMQMLGGRNDGGGGGGDGDFQSQDQPAQSAQPAAAPSGGGSTPADDDDLPF